MSGGTLKFSLVELALFLRPLSYGTPFFFFFFVNSSVVLNINHDAANSGINVRISSVNE